MQKLFKSRIFIFILGVISSVGITSVFAYELFASNVGFTPRDNKWDVDNTKEALDDLFTKVESLYHPNHFQLAMNDYGFNTTSGEVEYTSLGVTAKTYEDRVSRIEKTLVKPITLGREFELSTQVFINNTSNKYGGYYYLHLFSKVNDEYVRVAQLEIVDAWAATPQIGFYYGFKDVANGYNASGSNAWNTTNPSGRYALIGKNNKIYLYRGSLMLTSANCDLSQDTTIDKVTIEFWKYNESAFNPLPVTVEDVYVGDPLYYKTIIDSL